MGDLLVLYYSVCYSVGGAGLVLSVVQAIARFASAGPGGGKHFLERMGSREFLFACVQVSLALMLVPFFVITYFSRLGEQGLWPLGLWAASIAGQAILVFILPRFVLSVISDRRESAVRAVSAAAAVSIFACFPLNFIFQGTAFFLLLPMALMPATVLYSILAFTLRGKAERRAALERPDPERAFWLSLLAAISRLSALFLPFMLAFDFFPGLGAWAIGAFGLEVEITFKFFPLLYLAFAIVYVARIIPRLGRPAARDAVSEGGAGFDDDRGAGAAAFEGLSERELEVARLLISGLKYSDIGDRLFISLSTVKTHVERIYRKAGARSKIELAKALRAWPQADAGADAEGRAPVE